jgi:hypothetical protein
MMPKWQKFCEFFSTTKQGHFAFQEKKICKYFFTQLLSDIRKAVWCHATNNIQQQAPDILHQKEAQPKWKCSM